MPELQTATQAWVDILPPVMPAYEFPWWVSIVIVIAVTTMLLTLFRWYLSPRQRALRIIKHIQAKLDNTSEKEYKQLAFQINQAMKSGLRLKNPAIYHDNTFPGWQKFNQQLTNCCYRKQSPSPPELHQLCEQAHYWLRQRPNNGSHHRESCHATR